MSERPDPVPVGELIDLVEEHVGREGIPGVAMAVVAPGLDGVQHFQGHADLATGRPVQEDTVFRIGSVSKTMTAALLHQLLRDGQVGLDDPAAEHIRTLRLRQAPGGAPITLRHLLTHTAGLPEPRRYSDLLRPAMGLGIPVMAERPPLADLCGGDLSPVARPGVHWSYSNFGVALLGQVVEERAGNRFEDHAREALFTPLGMDSSDFRRTTRVQQHLAVGHQRSRRRGGRQVAVTDRDIAVPAAGSCFTTAGDMLRYLRALLTPAGEALRPAAGPVGLFDRIWDFQQLVGYGLCWPLEDPGLYGGHRIAWHAGNWPGFNSMLAVAPDAGAGVFLSMNTNRGGVAGSSIALGKMLMRKLLSVPEPGGETTLTSPGRAAEPRTFGTRGPRLLNLMPLAETGGRLRLSRTGDASGVLSSRLGPLKRGVPLTGDGSGTLTGSVAQFGLRSPVRVRVDGSRLYLTVNSVPMLMHERGWKESPNAHAST